MQPVPALPATATTGPAAPTTPAAPASLWPADLLDAFCLRMASQGMCVSRALMRHDRRYALEQLAHAHNMADDTLRAMAVQLFRHFERERSGIGSVH